MAIQKHATHSVNQAQEAGGVQFLQPLLVLQKEQPQDWCALPQEIIQVGVIVLIVRTQPCSPEYRSLHLPIGITTHTAQGSGLWSVPVFKDANDGPGVVGDVVWSVLVR